jgi:hypothetical protein
MQVEDLLTRDSHAETAHFGHLRNINPFGCRKELLLYGSHLRGDKTGFQFPRSSQADSMDSELWSPAVKSVGLARDDIRPWILAWVVNSIDLRQDN